MPVAHELMEVDGLSAQELATNELEDVLLAETKDHADWHFLEVLVQNLPEGDVRTVLAAAVAEVEAHLDWARRTLAAMDLGLAMEGPAPDPLRAHHVTTSPDVPIERVNPSPVTDGQLRPAQQPMWQPPIWLRQPRRT